MGYAPQPRRKGKEWTSRLCCSRSSMACRPQEGKAFAWRSEQADALRIEQEVRIRFRAACSNPTVCSGRGSAERANSGTGLNIEDSVRRSEKRVRRPGSETPAGAGRFSAGSRLAGASPSSFQGHPDPHRAQKGQQVLVHVYLLGGYPRESHSFTGRRCG